MSDESITERQGDRIIDLLEDILSELKDIQRETKRLDGIHDELLDSNRHLSSIDSDVTNIWLKKG